MTSLAKNTALLTAASVLQKAVAFVYFAAIARLVGKEDTGAYFLALALITTVGVLTDFGVNSVLIRDSARASIDEVRGLLRSVLGVKLVAAPIACAVAFVLPVLLQYDAATTHLIAIAIPIMLADSLSLSMYGALRGAQVLKYESIGIFVGQCVTTLVGVLVLWQFGSNLSWLIVALFLGSAWNAIFATIHVVRRLGVQAICPTFDRGRQILIAALPFFLAAVFVKLYSSFDSFTLRTFIGIGAVGVYSVAYKLTYAFQFLPLAFVGALYPKMSSLAHDTRALKQTFLDAVWYMALLAAPITFGIFALAPEIIHIAYGSSYAEAVTPLRVLILVLLPIFLDFPVGSLLNSSGRQNVKTTIMGVTMVVNGVANFVFIQAFGIVGASLAGLVSFSVMFGLGAFAIRRQIGMTFQDWMSGVGGFGISGVLMAFSILFVKYLLPLPDVGILKYFWIAYIPFGAAVFMVGAYTFGSIKKSHLDHVKSILHRKPEYGTVALDHE